MSLETYCLDLHLLKMKLNNSLNGSMIIFLTKWPNLQIKDHK